MALTTINAGGISESKTLINVATSDIDADVTSTNSESYVEFFATTYNPDGGDNNTSTIYAFLNLSMTISHAAAALGQAKLKYSISGDDVTNVTNALNDNWLGSYDYGDSGVQTKHCSVIALRPVTLDGTGSAALTYSVSSANAEAHANASWTAHGTGVNDETFLIFVEVG